MPNYSRRARVLRIKQTNGLNISTVNSTSPAHAFVMMPLWQFFMKFRGPKAHPNRPQKAMVCPTLLGLGVVVGVLAVQFRGAGAVGYDAENIVLAQ